MAPESAKKDPPRNRVWVANRQRKIPVSRPHLQEVAAYVLECLGLADREVSVVLVSDRGIRKLNRDYRGQNRPTDVLSFAQTEGEGGGLHPWYLGDVVISVETAQAQCGEAGTSLEGELRRLLIHGLLHLTGYEHTGSRGEAQDMKRKERQLAKMADIKFNC